MFYVPDGTHRCGLYTCEKCGSRFLDIKVGPRHFLIRSNFHIRIVGKSRIWKLDRMRKCQ